MFITRQINSYILGKTSKLGTFLELNNPLHKMYHENKVLPTCISTPNLDIMLLIVQPQVSVFIKKYHSKINCKMTGLLKDKFLYNSLH